MERVWQGWVGASRRCESTRTLSSQSYEVGSRFETRFPFSRFDAAPLAVPAAALLGTGDLAASAIGMGP